MSDKKSQKLEKFDFGGLNGNYLRVDRECKRREGVVGVEWVLSIWIGIFEVLYFVISIDFVASLCKDCFFLLVKYFVWCAR